MKSFLFNYFAFLGSIFANLMTTNCYQYDLVDFIGNFFSAQRYEYIYICQEANIGIAARTVERVLLQHMIRVSRLPQNPMNGAHILYLIKKAEEIHEITYLDGLLGKHPNQRITLAPLYSSSSVFKNNDSLLEISKTSHFFQISGVNKVFHIVKLSKSANVLRIKASYDPIYGIKQEIMDLQRIHLRMIAFTWFPHVDLKCSANISLPCEESGMGTEIISDMANLLNLTIDVYKEKDENWGFIPHGYYNISWSGVMGLVYKGEFDMSMPVFQINLHRAKKFDFLYSFSSLIGGFYFNRKMDPDLFYSPFLIDSWLVIIFIMIISVTLVITLSSFIGNYLRTQSFYILLLSISLFFVIIYAYYGAALTMFLSSKSTPTFQSLKEVILHPEWTLILRKGGENVILRDMINRIPEPAIIQYSNDVNAQPEKYLMPNIEEGLLKIRTGKFVFLIDYPPIGRLLKISADNKKKFSGFTVAHPRTVHYNFLLEKKSPLTYIFTPVALYVKEMGLVHAQKMRALGSLYFEAPESSTNPLDVRQLKSIFYFLFLSCFCSLTYCVLERFLIKRKDMNIKRELEALQQ